MTEVHGHASANQTPRYQAQYKGGDWHVYDARLNRWDDTPYASAREAQIAAEAWECQTMPS